MRGVNLYWLNRILILIILIPVKLKLQLPVKQKAILAVHEDGKNVRYDRY